MGTRPVAGSWAGRTVAVIPTLDHSGRSTSPCPTLRDSRCIGDTPVSRSRFRLLVLDLIAVAFALTTFVQGGEPDLLLHAVWVVLVIEAFAYGLGVSAPRIAIAAVLVVVYSVLEDSSGLTPLEVSDLVFTEWPLMLAIIIIVAVMADRVTSTSRSLAALERRTHEELLTAREDERRRLSADLHDGLGQTLAALVLTLDAAESTLSSAKPETVAGGREALRRAQEIVTVALEETHEVTHRLRPTRLQEIGLTTAIRELAANAGRPVDVEFDPRLAGGRLLPVEDEMQAYRIVQEAVGNAVRHASAVTIAIGMRLVRGGRLEIEVVDNGRGFDRRSVNTAGLGLLGMRERATAIGGTLSVESGPGAGTRIRLQLPVRMPVGAAAE